MLNRVLFAIVPALMLGLVACAGWFTVDGFECRYYDGNITVAGHRHFMHRGVDVYEVDGRYYRQHQGRWAEYRERPSDLQEAREEGRREEPRREEHH